jgi:tetratricopeptide (TPR) repeat protein
LSVPILSILLCGSKEPWALGLLATAVGMTALFATPKYRLSLWVAIPVLLGLALCLTAFLPATWFASPDWRVVLQRDFNIGMAFTRSPQPGITLESWLALAVGGVWLVCCASRGFEESERRRAIRVLVIFCGLVAGATLVVRWKGVVIPFWREPMDRLTRWDWIDLMGKTAQGDGKDWTYLGPFPNRNLLSEMLAVGAVLTFAATYDAYRLQQKGWLWLGLAIIPAFAAVLLNTSRTGVIVFFAGIGAWMFTAGFHKRFLPRVAIATTILLIMAAVVLLFGKQFLARLSTQNLATDARFQIFSDASKMIGHAPALGVGLGNFEPVFAMTRPAANLYGSTHHPENDWLWLGAEAGVPCVLMGVVVLAAMFRRFGPWRTRDPLGRKDRRMRNAAGVGVLLFLVAGMVDPALHAPGMFTLGCLLAGLAMRPSATAPIEATSRSRYWRKGAGVLCVLAGLAWFLTAAGHPVIRGNSVYHQLDKDAVALATRGDDAGALKKWNEAAAIKPLQWDPYFMRAMTELKLGHAAPEALLDFSRARQLAPHSALLCTHEFDIWQNYDPASGIPALREALKRDPSRAAEFFQGRVGKVHEHPELRPHYRSIAQSDPKLMLVYLPHAEPDEFASLLQELLAAHRTLEIYTPEEKLRLFQLWHAKGDAADLIQKLENNVEWQHDGWTVLAAHKAKEGDFNTAFEVAQRNVDKPREGAARPRSDLADLTLAFKLNPTDIVSGLDLYEAQRREGKYPEALATLDELAKIPRYPARILYERGMTLGAKGDYAQAWEALRDYDKRLQADKKLRQ